MSEREEAEKMAAEERQIEMFKIKKLIASLQKARGLVLSQGLSRGPSQWVVATARVALGITTLVPQKMIRAGNEPPADTAALLHDIGRINRAATFDYNRQECYGPPRA